MDFLPRLFLQYSPDDVMEKYGEGWALAYFFGMSAVFGVILIFSIITLGRFAHNRRRMRRTEWGRQHGLRLLDTADKVRGYFDYSASDIGNKILQDYPYYNDFKKKMSMSRHILEGNIDGLLCRVFEYSYVVGSGKYAVEHQHTVVAFHFDRVKPHTALRRHFWRDGLSKEDILTGREEFDDRFYIYADDWGLLQNELPQELEKLILDSVLFDLFLADRTLLLVAKGKLRNSGYDELFADARKLASFFYQKI